MPEAAPANTSVDSMLGRMVVEQGLATSEEVQDCLQLQRQLSHESDAKQRSLADVLVESGIVTRRQIDRLRPKVEEQRGGQQIPGFQIIDRLGAGAMATVYKAKQLSLDRIVAVKILPLKFTSNPQFVERFYAEGRAAAKLNHPNIVQAIDVGKAGEFHYFVMEYVDGKTVFDVLTDKGRMSEKDALKVMIMVARALEHAHAQGFIHRDVKPKNIMLTKDGTAKLADMGLARAVSDREAAEQEAGKAFGTPYYISPEQIRGEVNVDYRADIYSFGATLYHMVTGQVPFDASSPSAVMHKHLKAKLVPADQVNTSLSAGIAEVIEVCMAKDRERRYANTTDMLEDLQAVAQGEPPLQARRKFDLAQLAALETGEEAPPAASTEPPPLTAQPVFWLALAGWVLAALLLIAVAFSAGS